MENIEAVNLEGSSIIDMESGRMAFKVPIQGFKFEKSLMEEHFNENYLESDKYPHATFQGKVNNWEESNVSDSVTATGVLSIHGIEREVTIKGKMEKGPSPTISAQFQVRIADHKIKIPKVVFYNIAEIVEVNVFYKFKPYDK